jgi:hypothetical protein
MVSGCKNMHLNASPMLQNASKSSLIYVKGTILPDKTCLKNASFNRPRIGYVRLE